MPKIIKPKILAPAGDKYSFLAAVAAGADAIYCGLKNFSARMEANNFSIEELSRLNALARGKNIQVYVAFNSLVKQNELEQAAKTVAKLAKYVRPHALILQDIALIEIARKAGFKGEFHLSTLGNCSFAMGLEVAKDIGFSKVVLPRELTIDEIKLMAANRPEGLELEVFIHGALCYAVSGRCYWSSWFGGKSGLRGRCVQPCRRLYKQSLALTEPQSQEVKWQVNEQRFFSSLDFSADVLVKVLKNIEGVTTWKIEGRKKSPHYVFYTVKAYKMLRDHGDDPAQKKVALSFLEYALGRYATHYNLLPQNPINPLKKDKDIETGSGLFVGRVRYGGENLKPNTPNFITREALLKDDLLRIGYEDDSFHAIERVMMPIPKKGRFVININQRRGENLKKPEDRNYSKRLGFKKGTPVFIVDRREKEVWQIIGELEAEFNKYSSPDVRPQKSECSIYENSSVGSLSTKSKNNFLPNKNFSDILLSEEDSKIKTVGRDNFKGLWLSKESINRCSSKKIKDIWWFLPPVVWTSKQDIFYETIKIALSAGAKNFVLNMPWQIAVFRQIKDTFDKFTLKQLNIWAGPFCNIANKSYIDKLKELGFSGAFVSPELGKQDYANLALQSTLPLGIVLKGFFPLAISRVVSDEILPNKLFTSPRGEGAWVEQRDDNFWVFPNWQLDLRGIKDQLIDAGYKLFLTIEENTPKTVDIRSREGLWNWEIGLL
ncbi:MAG: U32 family peptidase [Desulfamplus sp.]|nr:U32 family peptidase [Desulfamplus sp.]